MDDDYFYDSLWNKMSELLFISPITKTNIKKPTRRGIPRVSFTRPAVGSIVDKIEEKSCPAKLVATKASMTVGTVVIIVGGEQQGKRAVVVADLGQGNIKVCGPAVPTLEISQDYLIGTSTKIEIAENSTEAQVLAAAQKTQDMVEYLKAPFTVKKNDRVHLMKF